MEGLNKTTNKSVYKVPSEIRCVTAALTETAETEELHNRTQRFRCVGHATRTH